jgi:hypothetical protein
MKRIILITSTLLILFNFESYSQIFFEKGYIIADDNQKTECLIKNIDWKNNPTEIEYKLSQNSEIQKGIIQNIKEFGIYGTSKYIKSKVKIDRSSDNINYMTSDPNPIFQDEQLFLKILTEGNASLLYYENGNLIRFFYKKDNSDVIQLVYKNYLINDNITKNNYFKQQLFNELKCPAINLENIKSINYTKIDLIRLFIKYNECTNSSYRNYDLLQKKHLFKLSIKPGLNLSSLNVKNSQADFLNSNFRNKLGLRFGVEAEFILPFNKNKWGIIVEPTYQYFKSENKKETKDVSGGIIISNIDYKSIELPFGIRHYFYLNEKSKVFINLFYVIDFSLNSSIKITRTDNTVLNLSDINSRRNFALGFGYKNKDRYSIELRYYTNREILDNYIFSNSDYKTTSLILGYRFL